MIREKQQDAGAGALRVAATEPRDQENEERDGCELTRPPVSYPRQFASDSPFDLWTPCLCGTPRHSQPVAFGVWLPACGHHAALLEDQRHTHLRPQPRGRHTRTVPYLAKRNEVRTQCRSDGALVNSQLHSSSILVVSETVRSLRRCD